MGSRNEGRPHECLSSVVFAATRWVFGGYRTTLMLNCPVPRDFHSASHSDK